MLLTAFAGPTMRILIEMTSNLLKFCVIWVCVLIMFTSFAMMIFGMLPAYATFGTAFTKLLETGVGTYDLSIYEPLEFNRMYGVAFTLVAVILSVILLSNYVIAVMMDTYAKLQSSRLGLYYNTLLGSVSAYKWDAHYGALIITFMPFNAFAFLLSPLFIVIKDQQKLRNMNWFLAVIGYVPLAMLLLAFYIPANLIMLPFAYVAALIKKIYLIRKISVADFVLFLVFGLLILLVSVFKDSFEFVLHCFN